jgi:hypothetical protein
LRVGLGAVGRWFRGIVVGLGLVWGWFGDILGAVWGWFGAGIMAVFGVGMEVVWQRIVNGLGMIWKWFGVVLRVAWGWGVGWGGLGVLWLLFWGWSATLPQGSGVGGYQELPIHCESCCKQGVWTPSRPGQARRSRGNA